MYKQGRCKKGDKCKYKHVEPSVPAVTTENKDDASPKAKATPRRKKKKETPVIAKTMEPTEETEDLRAGKRFHSPANVLRSTPG